MSAQTNTGSSGSTPTATPTATPKPSPEPEVPEVEVPEAEVPEVADAEPAPTPTPAKKPKPNDGAPPATTNAVKKVEPAAAASVQKDRPNDVQDDPTTNPAPKVAAASASIVTTAAKVGSPTQAAVLDVTPSLPAPAVFQNPLAVVTGMVSSVVNWMLTPFMNANTTAPAGTPMAWSLLAFARREFDNFVSAVTGRAIETPAEAVVTSSLVNTTFASAALAAAAVPAVPARPGFPAPGQAVSASTSFVDWVTGNYQPNNTYQRYGIWGTDVGTMWDNGIPDDPTTPINEHQVLVAFGDTFGGPNMTGTWRFNTLFRSSDTNLGDGMTVPDGQWLNGNMFGGSPLWESNYARQIILGERLPAGLPAGVTLIPTAGISVPTPGTQFGATQYLSFMSVKQWGAAGQWTTNYSAMAYSTDNGENWYVAPSSVRQNDAWSGNANFQQASLVRPGDGYVYSYGTPNGRQGAAYVSRVVEKDILDVSKYEYYSKGTAGGWFGIGATPAGWYKNAPSKATPVFGGTEQGACGAVNPGSQVSEMSVQYNKQLKKYVALYGDQSNSIVMRTSDTPQGTWSAPKVLMNQQPGGIYAPMMHPWSPSTMGTGTDLYWNLSLWSEYNVMLMKTDLTKV